MKPTRPWSRSTLLRLLSRRRGYVRAIRDLRYITEVLRFSVLFASLVLVPVILLAMLALRSLQAEELLVDAGLRQRAESIAAQVEAGLQSRFDELQVEILSRIDTGDPNLSGLQATGLRAVFRFDAEGRMVAPFALATEADRWQEPSAAFERAWNEGRRLEAEGDLAAATTAYGEASDLAVAPEHEAEARFAAARAMIRAGDPKGVSELLYVTSEMPQARDRRGVRLADLSALIRADLASKAGDEDGAVRLLRGLVDRDLAAAWLVGFSGEAFATEQALERLDGHMDPDAFRLARSRLLDRSSKLYWATSLEDELRLVASRGRGDRRFDFHPEEKALWMTVRVNDALWALSFDYDAVQADLARRVVEVASGADPDLTARLVGAREDLGEGLVRRSLAPELPRVAVIVSAADPDALTSQRARTRWQRRFVIMLAVLSAALGMVAAVRTVNRELDAARQKADFAANVSHELRSPITQIRLKGESLQLDLVFDDADRQEHYDAIVREAERLSRLVDNVLDFSSIERGVKKYTLRPEDIGDVVRKAVEATESSATQAGLRMVVDVPDDLPVVWADREAISQVMTNLLSNAVKYGSGGETIDVVGRVGLEGLDVSIRDHGIGIDEPDQAKIFDHFYRVSSAEVRRRRGTGIGLTIVRYIVEAHGGSITVDSALGEGSTFTVTLPLDPPDGAGG
ncbi:MAG: HAMP domain-containing histidine kinase [Alphaproteobacteria bacterium]|nr:HAMP domain-containing histidine kinase [Alphaproteobacteria bacterium]